MSEESTSQLEYARERFCMLEQVLVWNVRLISALWNALLHVQSTCIKPAKKGTMRVEHKAIKKARELSGVENILLSKSSKSALGCDLVIDT